MTLELANQYHADIVVGYDNLGITDLLDTQQLVTLGTKTPALSVRALRLIYAFTNRTHFIKNYPWVIYSGNYAPLAVKNNETGKNILYCHNLPRFIYDLKEYYQSRYKGLRAPLLSTLVKLLKPRYETALNQMDHIIANSENVRKRIQTFVGKEAVVIHPPCAVDEQQWAGQEGYYLSLARLEPYKRVDELIKAFLKMPDRTLIVASGGSEFQRLKSMAGDAVNIRFTGWLDEQELKNLIGKAIATLYIPIDEDFGMSPVESMAAGKPVIGVAEGGILETVIHNETGTLLSSDPSSEEIINAVEQMTPAYALEMRSACECRAQIFSRDAFFNKMRQYIAN